MLKCKKDGHEVFLAVVIRFPGQCVNYTIVESTGSSFISRCVSSCFLSLRFKIGIHSPQT